MNWWIERLIDAFRIIFVSNRPYLPWTLSIPIPIVTYGVSGMRVWLSCPHAEKDKVH
jgi:hypothetical protein